jgi:hypothetical protein
MLLPGEHRVTLIDARRPAREKSALHARARATSSAGAAENSAMKQVLSTPKERPESVWADGPSLARPSNFFHPDANAPAMSRRAMRAERRRQRREQRRIRPLTVAFVLLSLGGLVGIAVLAHALR